MTMRFPTAIQKIDLDAAANWVATIDSNRSITKVWPCFAVPRAELGNVDFIASGADEMFSEIPGKPASLELQLRWNPRRNEERPFTNAISIA